MKPHPTDGNLDALRRHLDEQERDTSPPPDDWEDEERAHQSWHRRRNRHDD